MADIYVTIQCKLEVTCWPMNVCDDVVKKNFSTLQIVYCSLHTYVCMITLEYVYEKFRL